MADSLLCASRNAGEATLWAEFGDVTSEESVVALEAGMPHDVELRLLPSQTRTGRLVGLFATAVRMSSWPRRPRRSPATPARCRIKRRGRFVLSGIPVGDAGEALVFVLAWLP